MTDSFTFREGDTPLLISVPHDGKSVPDEIAASMTGEGRQLPDTDWHVARLYSFAEDMGASVISATYSRYVVDLNRPADDKALYTGQMATGLCPRQTFDGCAIYDGDVAIDVEDRLARFWRPYHDQVRTTLDRLLDRHGCALLWDAHSIASRVPALFEGELPVLNIGDFNGRSCSPKRTEAVAAAANDSSYSVVVNGRFKGGYITRHYGDPENGVHAIQLELAQRAYMDEASGAYDEMAASQLRDTLRSMIVAFTMRA